MASSQQIAVELVARMDGLTAGFRAATRSAETSAQKMQNSFEGVRGSIAKVGAALAAGVSVRWMSGLIADSIRATGNLKDLSESTGVAATTLAKFDISARTSEVGIDTVANAMSRLAKGMSGVGEDSKGIPQALKAIGLDFKSFKELSPDEQMLAVAKSFDNFQDGSGKAAVAMALFGKEGAKLIPFFKDLVENQDLAAGRTQAMIDAADEYAKATKRLEIAGGDMIAIALAPLVPILTDAAKAMAETIAKTNSLSEADSDMASSSGISSWGKDAVWVLAQVMNAIQVTSRGFQTLGTGASYSIDTVTEVIKRGGQPGLILDAVRGNLWKNYGARADALKKEVQGIYKEALIGNQMLDNFNARQSTVQAVTRQPTKKPKVDYTTNTEKGGSKAAKEQLSDYEKLVNTINEKIAVQNEELGLTRKLSDAEKEYAKFKAQVAAGTLKLSADEMAAAEVLWQKFKDGAEKLKAQAQQKVFDAAQLNIKSLAESYARDNDARIAAMAIMPESQRALITAKNAIDEKGRVEADKYAEALRKGEIELFQYTALIDSLNATMSAQKSRTEELAAMQDKLNASFEYGTQKGLQSYIDSVANVAKSSEELMTNAFKGMEDALVSFVQTGKLDFKSLVNSILADMARISIRQNITGPLAQWMNGGSGGGFGLSSLFNLFGGGTSSAMSSAMFNEGMFFADGGVIKSPSLSAFSGSVVDRPTLFKFASGAGLMGEAGAEAILPLKRGSNGKLGVQAGGGMSPVINITINGNQSAPDVRRSAAQGAREALSAFNMAGRYA